MKIIVVIIGYILLPYFAYTQVRGIDICSDSSCLYFYQSGKILLPEWVSTCKKIKEVYLSRQSEDLFDIMEQLSQINNIEKIVIQNVGLKNLPYNIYKIKKLRHLDLRGNHLRSLPYSIRFCDSLSGIDLDDNEMSNYGLVYIFKNVSQLHWFSVGNNMLYSIPSEICLANNLMMLDISDNKLSELPTCIYSMQSLKVLIVNSHWNDRQPTSQNPVSVSKIKDNFLKNGLQVRIE